MDDRPRAGQRVELTVSWHVDEIQELTSTATGGTWRAVVAGGRTRPIRWDATWRDIEAAVQAVPGMRRAECWGGPLPAEPVSVRFPGHVEAPPVGIDSSALTGGEVTVATTQDGGPIILDDDPTVTVTPTVPVTVDHLGGGVYRATLTPEAAGTHRVDAAGESTVHGPVRLPKPTTFTVR